MDLIKIREEIDKVDNELSKLFIKRMELVREVSKEKAKQSINIEHIDREKEIVARLIKDCPEEFNPYLQKLYDCLFILSKDFQKENG